MTENNYEESDAETKSWTLEGYSRREWLGLIVMLWLAGSLSDFRALRLVYGLQGYGWYWYGDAPRDG